MKNLNVTFGVVVVLVLANEVAAKGNAVTQLIPPGQNSRHFANDISETFSRMTTIVF